MDKQMTFDEWWKVNELKYDYVFPASRDAFKAGQQSRQVEVDEKDKRIEEALNHLNDVRNKGMDQSCYLAIKALRGECE